MLGESPWHARPAGYKGDPPAAFLHAPTEARRIEHMIATVDAARHLDRDRRTICEHMTTNPSTNAAHRNRSLHPSALRAMRLAPLALLLIPIVAAQPFTPSDFVAASVEEVYNDLAGYILGRPSDSTVHRHPVETHRGTVWLAGLYADALDATLEGLCATLTQTLDQRDADCSRADSHAALLAAPPPARDTEGVYRRGYGSGSEDAREQIAEQVQQIRGEVRDMPLPVVVTPPPAESLVRVGGTFATSTSRTSPTPVSPISTTKRLARRSLGQNTNGSFGGHLTGIATGTNSMVLVGDRVILAITPGDDLTYPVPVGLDQAGDAFYFDTLGNVIPLGDGDGTQYHGRADPRNALKVTAEGYSVDFHDGRLSFYSDDSLTDWTPVFDIEWPGGAPFEGDPTVTETPVVFREAHNRSGANYKDLSVLHVGKSHREYAHSEGYVHRMNIESPTLVNNPSVMVRTERGGPFLWADPYGGASEDPPGNGGRAVRWEAMEGVLFLPILFDESPAWYLFSQDGTYTAGPNTETFSGAFGKPQFQQGDAWEAGGELYMTDPSGGLFRMSEDMKLDRLTPGYHFTVELKSRNAFFVFEDALHRVAPDGAVSRLAGSDFVHVEDIERGNATAFVAHPDGTLWSAGSYPLDGTSDVEASVFAAGSVLAPSAAVEPSATEPPVIDPSEPTDPCAGMGARDRRPEQPSGARHR